MQDRAGHPRERERSRAHHHRIIITWPLHGYPHRRTYARTHRSFGVYIFACHAIRSANIMRATRRVITLFRYTIDLCNCTARVLSLPLTPSPPRLCSFFSFFVSINIVVYDGCTPCVRIRVSVRAHTSRRDAVVNLGSL